MEVHTLVGVRPKHAPERVLDDVPDTLVGTQLPPPLLPDFESRQVRA